MERNRRKGRESVTVMVEVVVNLGGYENGMMKMVVV